MNRIDSLKYLSSTTLGCKDIGIRISKFVAKIQFLSWKTPMSSLLGLDDKLHGLYDELKISGNIFQGLDDKLLGLDTKLLAYCYV